MGVLVAHPKIWQKKIVPLFHTFCNSATQSIPRAVLMTPEALSGGIEPSQGAELGFLLVGHRLGHRRA
jgi:hypothetical protein